MSKVKRMQTVQIETPHTRRVALTNPLEHIFEQLVSEFKLDVHKKKLEIDMIRDSEAQGDKYLLHYQRFWMDKNVQDEGFHYSGKPLGWPLEIYASSRYSEPSITYTVPASKLMKYRLFLVDLSKKYHDLADRVAVGQFSIEPRLVGKKTNRVYSKLTPDDFSEFYYFLKGHIKP